MKSISFYTWSYLEPFLKGNTIKLQTKKNEAGLSGYQTTSDLASNCEVFPWSKAPTVNLDENSIQWNKYQKLPKMEPDDTNQLYGQKFPHVNK